MTIRKLTADEKATRDAKRNAELEAKRQRFNDGAPLGGLHIGKLADLPWQECTQYRKREYGYLLEVNGLWYFGNSALNRACEVGTPCPFMFRVLSTVRTYGDSKVFDIEYR